MLYCCLNAGVYRTEDSRDILLAFYQGVVGTWSFPHESAMVQTRHGETHVITAGDKSRPALVLLHGAAANVLGWGAAMPEYMRDFFVIAPDIPGEAGRSAPEPCRVLMIRGGEDAFFNAARQAYA